MFSKSSVPTTFCLNTCAVYIPTDEWINKSNCYFYRKYVAKIVY